MVALKTKLLFLVVVSYHTLVKLRPILALAPREAISFFHLLDTWSDFLKWFIDACRQLLLISKQPASRRVWTLLVRMLAGRTCLLRLCRWIHCWGGGHMGRMLIFQSRYSCSSIKKNKQEKLIIIVLVYWLSRMRGRFSHSQTCFVI